MQVDSTSNIVSLPFMAATRAASAPALGRFGHVFGGSAVMHEVYRRIDKVARTSATVLITGESGSGKELVARTIHDRSECSQAPFVAVNCGAFPATLIEAELFGYEKGAFTGAARMHRGCFERAEGGTLFLDEVTEMAPERELKNALQRAFILADADAEIELDFAGLELAPPTGNSLRVEVGTPLAEIERRAIYATLDLCEGNKRRCAEMLGVSLKTLYNRLAEYQSGEFGVATV